MEWVAIDFETATGRRDSACALGVVRVVDGAIVEERSWLMRPPGNEYTWFTMAIHGIAPEDTEDAPAFEELYEEIEPYLSDALLVAHNAPFDMSVLRSCLQSAALPPLRSWYVCTLALSRACFDDMERHTLPDVAGRCGLLLDRHHDATCDARAAAQIAIYLTRRKGQPDPVALAEHMGVRVGTLAPPGEGSR